MYRKRSRAGELPVLIPSPLNREPAVSPHLHVAHLTLSVAVVLGVGVRTPGGGGGEDYLVSWPDRKERR